MHKKLSTASGKNLFTNIIPKSGNDATDECKRDILANILQTYIADTVSNKVNQPS